MQEPEITKSVPIPSDKSTKYPFRKLKIGESFVVSPDKEMSVRSSANYYSKNFGSKFTARKTDEGIRVWRIK